MKASAGWQSAADELVAALKNTRVKLTDLLLAIAAAEHPRIDRVRIEIELDRYAREVAERVARRRMNEAQEPASTVTHRTEQARRELYILADVLATEGGFRGDEQDYHDPANSLLDRVLERRRGMPILLSCLYCEIAQRARIPLVGVALPGHFIVRHAAAASPLFADPFDHGRVLRIGDLQPILDRVHKGTLTLRPSMLAPASPLEITIRVLRNLKASHLSRSEFSEAFGVTEAIVRLAPKQATEWWDRGRIRLQLGDRLGALEDFRHCVDAVPSSPLQREAEQAIASIRLSYLQQN